MALGERAEAMARRLRRTVARLGIEREGADRLDATFRLAMERRLDLDDHHPDHLHPARTALILMDDAGLTDVLALAAATTIDTRTPQLAPDREEIRALAPAVADLAGTVPSPEPVETLVERLVTAEPRVQLIAVAERLDHARHLHLRPEGEWAEDHALVERAYAPLAERVHPTLARRYRTWCGVFARRYLAST